MPANAHRFCMEDHSLKASSRSRAHTHFHVRVRADRHVQTQELLASACLTHSQTDIGYEGQLKLYCGAVREVLASVGSVRTSEGHLGMEIIHLIWQPGD